MNDSTKIVNNFYQTARAAFKNTDFATEQLTFLAVWWLCFLIYPLWYLPASNTIRALTCAGLFAIFIVCLLLFKSLNVFGQSATNKTETQTNDGHFFLVLFSLAYTCHVPFLYKPILTGLDTIDHAAIPAVLAHKIAQGITTRTGVPLSTLLTILTVTGAAAFSISPTARRIVHKTFTRIASLTAQHLWKTITVLGVVTVIYAYTLISVAAFERFPDLNPIFRYQPISKLTLIPLYIIFGLHEWIGRILQIAFTFAGAFYLYRITGLFGTKTASRTAAILYVFLPPVFHYSNTHMIEGGLLFFMIASFYHWIRYLEKNERRDLIRGTLFCTLACLYKHPAVSVIPAFTAMGIYDYLFPKPAQTRHIPWGTVIACAIPSITFITFMKLAGFNTDAPTEVKTLNLATNLQTISLGDTLPVALLFLTGSISLALTKPFRRFVYLFAWIGVHYVLVSLSSNADNVRQALPYHAGLCVVAALLVDRCPIKYKRIQSILVYGVLPVFLFWACLLMDRRQDFLKVGRPMSDRSYITLSNIKESYLPYPAAIRALRDLTAPGDTIYAPMANEPVHFYLAKYDLNGRNYIRKIWASPDQQTAENLLAHCRDIGAEWLLLPRGKWAYRYLDLDLVESIFQNPPPGLKPIRIVSEGRESIGIWRVQM